jgi:NMT1-like family
MQGMTKVIRYTLLSIRDLLASFGPFVLLSIALLVLAYWWLEPTPPKRVSLATGPEQSAYDEFGKRYAQLLAREGITVELVRTEGSSANLQLLREGKVDLGFVQGGSSEQGNGEDALQSLGSLFLEPVWMFYREDSAKKISGNGQFQALQQLSGLRVNVGTAGSGVPALMSKLLQANRVEAQTLTLSRLEQTPATVAFLNGELDVIVFASAPESLMVQMLLQTPGVRLFDFAQSEAYARRFAFLSPVVLPRGVVDLAADNPARDVRLVAPTTTLLAKSTVHPALLQLFSQAAAQLHGGAGWFNRARQYPNVENNELPLAKEAERYIKNGPPLLQRYLPFWAANLIERMWLALGIIVAVLLPLSRILPPLYEFRIRSRVFRWYARLREIEQRADNSAPGPETISGLLGELNELDDKAGKIQVPLSYVDELYALRSNIHLVRKKLLR